MINIRIPEVFRKAGLALLLSKSASPAKTRFSKNLGYIRLMRLDKPIGSLLLWYPTAWALWTANAGLPPVKILFLFALGTFLMRSAGCVINDFLDKDFDKMVERTKNRPLATGEISLKSALALLGSLLFFALIILFNLPTSCIKYALIALALTLVYPLCKRIINAPQCVLGFAFSMGIPMAYAAAGKVMDQHAMLLFIINMLWIIAYDTIYAMADKKDDILAGIKSTAVYLGIYDKWLVTLLQICMHGLWLFWAYTMQVNTGFYICWILAATTLLWQQWLIRIPTLETCIQAFLANNYYGALMWLAIISG